MCRVMLPVSEGMSEGKQKSLFTERKMHKSNM